MISYSLAELSTDSSATYDPPGTFIEIDDRNPTMSRFQRAFKDAPKYFKVALSEKRQNGSSVTIILNDSNMDLLMD
ncbi:11989_t:CDS:2 [Funneliformis mosseae]|uniref:11989_t:CDS:1 n=1 Tax=Funneliformis mosseae TaxID=27381 RepID=A0A9N9HHT4_FUNMO|nr:11989_t:CDS:2 [Funneliformis mosseae]